jgi:hypothetical protein
MPTPLLPRSCFALAAACATVAGWAAPAWDLRALPRAHPWLWLTPARAARLATPADPHLRQMENELRQAAEWALAEPVVQHELVGPRLLAQSRACLARVATLALASRVFSDERYLARAERELDAAAAMPDWNPSHFLDTAELCTAFAVGYDWLYDRLTPGRREAWRKALVEKGLRPGLDPECRARFAGRENNWNPVCNAGLVLGALAIAGEDPQWAERLLPAMAASLPKALASYAPDGAWYEGPGYWKYGTTYLALLLDGLQTALGSDGGLGSAPGLARTGDFFRAAIGPTGRFFNYADSGEWPGTSPTLYWLAQRYDRPELAAFEWGLQRRMFGLLAARTRAQVHASEDTEILLGNVELADLIYSNRFYAWELLWYQPPAVVAAPRLAGRRFDGVTDVVFLRGAPDAPEAFYLGAKGAGLPNSHAHLDAGSFVLDALGERWAEDLGPENYDLPGYWDMSESGARWRYFRLGSLSHNIVTLDGRNQRPGCRVPLTTFYADADQAHACFDLTAAYAGQAAAASRGFALLDAQTVLVQDEFTGGAKDADARWAMLTGADVVLDGATAILRLHGRELRARVLAPADAHWRLESAQPQTAVETPNPGKRLLTLHVLLPAGAPVRMAVEFTPAAAPARPVIPVPLAAWTGAEPLRLERAR